MITSTHNRMLSVAVAASLLGAVTSLPAVAHASASGVAVGSDARGSVVRSSVVRGSVVRIDHLRGIDAAGTRTYLDDHGFGSPAARFGVDLYRLTYGTVDVVGRPTRASGLVVLPRRSGTALSPVVYEHGTTVPRDAVATADPDGYDAAASVMFAASGYLAVAPDYLGLGTGPGRHPYLDLASEVSVSVDLLHAARSFAGDRGVGVRPGVRVTGFSQGGAAAMALGAALQRGAAAGFTVSAVAPVSGPYDLQHAELPAALGSDVLDPTEVSFYLAYITVAWARTYPGSVPPHPFTAAYADVIPTVFDGRHNYDEIYAALPSDVHRMLTPDWLATLAHPTGALLKAMRADDTSCAWRPGVPVRLWAARGDRDVAFADAESCRDQLAARGVTATLTDVGDTDHNGSALASFPQVLRWFATVPA